jgi:hypothetical protein
MRANERPEVPHFHNDEHLFRRVPLFIWDDAADELGVEAIELPDISVGRSKFGHAEWVRFDVVNNKHYEEWAVIGVKVSEIPIAIWRDGYPKFWFKPCHVPLERDYPHSEIRAFDEIGKHVQIADLLPEDIHLEWRERLLRKMKTIIKPYEIVAVRQNPPISHLIEQHHVIS